MSKPRSLRRSTRSLMRQRSDSGNDSDSVSSRQSERYDSTMPVGDGDRIESLVEPSAGFQVEQLAGDVDPGDLEVVLALTVGEPAVVELAGLRVDEVGGERARIPTEQRVRERHVAPEEADDVQPREQHRERVDEPGRGVRAQRLRVEGAVGERELQVAGDERRLELFAVVGRAVGHDGDRFDARDVEALQRAQQVVLATGEFGRGLLDGDDVPAEVDEPDEVARDALGERRDRLVGPELEREVPGEVEECRVGHGRRDGERGTHGPSLESRVSSDPVVEYVRPHGLRRMLGRDPLERHRTVTPLELLFDLTFVVAFAQAGDQLAHYVAEGHIATAVWGFVFVVLSVCWAWINFTWFASAFDTDDWFQRSLTMVQMIGVIILALGIPAVFASIDPGEPFDFMVVAVGYVVMRVSLVADVVRVARQDPANRRVALRYAVLQRDHPGRMGDGRVAHDRERALLVALLVVLWAAEFAGHPFATWNAKDADGQWQGTPWNADHIAERYGLLVIITLGEGILGTIAAVAAVVAHVGWSGEAVLIVIAGIGLTFGLWWTYFIVPSAPVLARHRERKWAWGYGHARRIARTAGGLGLLEDERRVADLGADPRPLTAGLLLEADEDALIRRQVLVDERDRARSRSGEVARARQHEAGQLESSRSQRYRCTRVHEEREDVGARRRDAVSARRERHLQPGLAGGGVGHVEARERREVGVADDDRGLNEVDGRAGNPGEARGREGRECRRPEDGAEIDLADPVLLRPPLRIDIVLEGRDVEVAILELFSKSPEALLFMPHTL